MAADQEMLREIKRVLELTARVDERVKNIAESHEKMATRYEQFLEQHNELVARVNKIENTTWSGEKIESHFQEVKEDHRKLSTRVSIVENNTPYALKIVDQSLEALNRLSDRIAKVESDQNGVGVTVKTWQGWLVWFSDWCFKVAWIVIAAYILARVGLGSVNLPTPF